MRRLAFLLCLLSAFALGDHLGAWAATPNTHTTKACTTSSSQVYAASSVRTKLVLQNTSDTDIYVNLAGAAAVVGEGLLIKAGATFWDDIVTGVTNKAVTCIHGGSGSKTLLGTQSGN